MRSISVSQCQHIKMSGNSCVRPQPPGEVCVSVAGSGEYDQPDVMLYGVQKVKDSSASSLHPLEYSLKHWTENAAMRDLDMLKITQGLHAPLKLQMERKVTSRPLRLPCLQGSNVMYETLTGDDESIGFVDLFNNEDSEQNLNVHLAMEKQGHIM